MFFLYFLSHRGLENVLESSRKRKSRERERERERAGEIDLESSRKRKRRELGYTCVVEKKQEKKKRVDAIERKNNIKNKK